jgi:hypothetical protein
MTRFSDMAEMIYDDEEIRVLWAPHRSHCVLITFGDLVTANPAYGHTFFAETPLHKLQISAVGIVAKSGNWYPMRSMQRVVKIVDDFIDEYETRITYGGSMGGYGAIKYSRLFDATHVLALCPQWSIDNGECKGVDAGYGNYFVPEMAGMGIRESDVSGNVFLFADALDKRDMFHRQMIMENYADSYFVNVPLVGHNVTTVIAGTVNLQELIDACVAKDVAAMRKISRRARRSHSIWQKQWLHYGMIKTPRLAASFLLNSENRALLREEWRYLPKVLSHLATTIGLKQAIALYDECRSALPGPAVQQLMCAYVASLSKGLVAVETSHDSWLVYDLIENNLVHTCVPFAPWTVPVQAEIVGSSAKLFVSVGETKVWLAVLDLRLVGVANVAVADEEHFLFEVQPGTDGRFAIAHFGKYLCAEPQGNVVCDRDIANDWEMFSFSVMTSGFLPEG